MGSSMSTRPSVEPPFLNRELSLLKFNERVLAMAENPKVPLLERLRYVCIVSSNLDEFFEIRISSLKEQQRQNPSLVGPDGRTPAEALERVPEKVHALLDRQYTLLNAAIIPPRHRGGSGVPPYSKWTADP